MTPELTATVDRSPVQHQLTAANTSGAFYHNHIFLLLRPDGVFSKCYSRNASAAIGADGDGRCGAAAPRVRERSDDNRRGVDAQLHDDADPARQSPALDDAASLRLASYTTTAGAAGIDSQQHFLFAHFIICSFYNNNENTARNGGATESSRPMTPDERREFDARFNGTQQEASIEFAIDPDAAAELLRSDNIKRASVSVNR